MTGGTMRESNAGELPLPPFHQSSQAEDWAYAPSVPVLHAAAETWRRAHGIRPAATDRRKVHLFLVDTQKDFCLPAGSLFVGGRSGRGAVDDTRRIVEFIYRNLGQITEITVTLDTHIPHQIFFPAFWQDEGGNAPSAHRFVTGDDIRGGHLRPRSDLASWLAGGDADWLLRQAEFYCDTLEATGKYRLYLWPPHCLLGGEGHLLVGAVQQARLFHAFVRGSRNDLVVKGDEPLTESYSVFAPEVRLRFDGEPLGTRNHDLARRLLEADAIVIAGQAASHCVKSSVEDFLGEINSLDPRLAEKVYLLTDCMSAVAVPDADQPGAFLADFTTEAQDALAQFARAGIHIVSSTDPMPSWPGIG